MAAEAASPPTRTYSYVTGTTISSSAVTSNEDSLFNYLSLGVDTYADNSILGDDINTSAAIPYSKLSLSNSIVNADINSSAAIAYSKLTLTGAVLNADLAGSIADTKLSQITTASKVHGTSITGLASLPAGAGVVPVANLGSGSPSSANFLRGDGAFATVNNTSNTIFSFSGSHLARIYQGSTSNPAFPQTLTFGGWAVDGNTLTTVIATKWTKIAGVSTVTFYAYVIEETSSSGDVEVKVDIGGANATATDTTTALTWITTTIDVSGLSNGSNYDVVIQLRNTTGGEAAYLYSIIAFGS